MTGAVAPMRTETEGGRRRRLRRGGRDDTAVSAGLRQPAWRNLRNLYAPVEVVSPDAIEKIHDASLRVLEEIGMDFLLPEARQLLKAAGADVKAGEERIRLDRGMVEEFVAKAPSEFTLHARNPARNLRDRRQQSQFLYRG